MKRFFIHKDVDTLDNFQSAIKYKKTKISRQSLRKAFKEIGLEFDYSLIEDLKRKVTSEKSITSNPLGDRILHCLVVLFVDHLLIQRIDRSQNGNKAFEMSFSDLFNVDENAHLYMTKRQYKTSITYMYKNTPRITQFDPFLLFSNRNGKDASTVNIKKSDCIKFLFSREFVIEQIASEIREVSSVNLLTVNELGFVRIYNRCLSFIQTLSRDDVSLITKKESIVLKGML